MEARWRQDVLEVEYDSSAEENYSALPMQTGDIGVSFEPWLKGQESYIGCDIQGEDLPLAQHADLLFWSFSFC